MAYSQLHIINSMCIIQYSVQLNVQFYITLHLIQKLLINLMLFYNKCLRSTTKLKYSIIVLIHIFHHFVDKLKEQINTTKTKTL